MKKQLSFLIFIALALLAFQIVHGAAANSFTGIWETVSSTGNRFTMQLKESNNTVRGTYSPENGTIDGIVKGNALNFNWSQAGGYTGTGTFTRSSDGNSFSGVWFNISGGSGQTQGTWTGRRK
ncbi:MAG: hypothetical protein HOP02_15665 [Methylococcaceae bacterium]|nr:hypothetical protein [Methylococcaceae bacterium]